MFLSFMHDTDQRPNYCQSLPTATYHISVTMKLFLTRCRKVAASTTSNLISLNCFSKEDRSIRHHTKTREKTQVRRRMMIPSKFGITPEKIENLVINQITFESYYSLL